MVLVCEAACISPNLVCACVVCCVLYSVRVGGMMICTYFVLLSSNLLSFLIYHCLQDEWSRLNGVRW